MKRFYVANKVIRELQLSSKAINVYDYLCMCVDRNHECFPRKRTIASNCSISVASVTRALRELENAKMISTVARFEYVEHEKCYIRQTSNIYHIYETPEIADDNTHATEPSDDLKAEPENVPTLPELCACEQQQDEVTLDKAIVENSTNDDSVLSIANEQTVESASKVQDDVHPAGTEEVSEGESHKHLIAYFLFCTLLLVKNLFLRPFCSKIDTPPRLTVTRQGTRTKLKVTDNFRNTSKFSKLAKWYRLHKYTKYAG